MTRKHWIVLGLFLLGFSWAPAWLFAVALYEFGIRHGRTVAAFWASGLINSRRGGGGGH